MTTKTYYNPNTFHQMLLRNFYFILFIYLFIIYLFIYL